jgi:uncharacterized protein (TIGR02284 family)
MAATTSEFLSTLNGLIETCKDGEDGFRKAAEGIKDASLRTVFMEYAQQRERFAQELQKQVAQLGGKPEHSGSISAALHRGWIDMKSVVTSQDDRAILNECERGEDSAVRNYKAALAEDIPADLRSLVSSQYDEVQKAHDHIRDLRNQHR